MPFPTFEELKSDFRMARNGQRRVAPYGTRGRVYDWKQRDKKPLGIMGVLVTPKALISMRVWNEIDQRYYTPEEQNHRIKQQIRKGLVNPANIRIEDVGER